MRSLITLVLKTKVRDFSATITNKGQEEKADFYFSHPKDELGKIDFTQTIFLLPSEVVNGWRFEDYKNAGFKVVHCDNGQTLF
jgi:hypothetical protein